MEIYHLTHNVLPKVIFGREIIYFSLYLARAGKCDTEVQIVALMNYKSISTLLYTDSLKKSVQFENFNLHVPWKNNRLQGFMNFKGEILKNDFYRTLV